MEEQVKYFLELARSRREKGKETYGDNAYKNKDMYKEMQEELLDIINYALFQLMKLDEARTTVQKFQELSEIFLDVTETPRLVDDTRVIFEPEDTDIISE